MRCIYARWSPHGSVYAAADVHTDDVFDGAAQYLRIYFYGVSGLMIYNMGAGILQPWAIQTSAILSDGFRAHQHSAGSGVCDILRLGIAGVAIATVIAQCLSAALVLMYSRARQHLTAFSWSHMRSTPAMLRSIWKIGLPSALQQAITSFSNVFVQSYVNQFGSACMAGWTSYGKIDQFILLPMQSMALSTTTFVAKIWG